VSCPVFCTDSLYAVNSPPTVWTRTPFDIRILVHVSSRCEALILREDAGWHKGSHHVAADNHATVLSHTDEHVCVDLSLTDFDSQVFTPAVVAEQMVTRQRWARHPSSRVEVIKTDLTQLLLVIFSHVTILERRLLHTVLVACHLEIDPFHIEHGAGKVLISELDRVALLLSNVPGKRKVRPR
jgi:hypothetical protein